MQRIITLADDAVVAGLHGARDSAHPEKYIIPSNAVAGTYRDKRDRQTGGTVNIIALVTARAAEIQATIDAEYRLLDDGDGNTSDDTAMVVSPPATREAKDGTSASETNDGTQTEHTDR